MWDLPRPGLEPVFLALAGRFSTAAPPGKPLGTAIFNQMIGSPDDCNMQVDLKDADLSSFKNYLLKLS